MKGWIPMKKILAIVLSVAMMMTAFAVGASAEGAVPITFTAESVTANKGDIITVDISVSENHYMVNGQIWVQYNPDCLEIVEVWDDPDCPYFEEINTKIFRSSYMWMFAVPVAGTAKFAFASSASAGTTAGGAMFTLTFKVLEDAYTSEINVVVPDGDMNANDGSSAEDQAVELTYVAGVVTVEGTTPPAPPVEDVEGDVNIDGKLDVQDARWLFFYVNRAQPYPPVEQQLAKADINGDGEINLFDAARLFYIVNDLL